MLWLGAAIAVAVAVSAVVAAEVRVTVAVAAAAVFCGCCCCCSAAVGFALNSQSHYNATDFGLFGLGHESVVIHNTLGMAAIFIMRSYQGLIVPFHANGQV